MRNEKGSLTVEAAISLPIFLFVILSISFLIKAAYVHEVIQHAIYETANEISTYSYMLAASGVKDLDDTIKKGVEERSALFNEHLDDFAEAYVSINDFNNDTNFTNIEEKYKDFEEKINAALESGKEIYNNPIDEAYSLMFSMGGLVYEDSKSFVLQNVTKLLVRKYISPNDISKTNDKLKVLNIDGGLKDLDFSQSQFFKNGDDIDIIVRYKLNLVLPIDILPDLYIIQRSTVRGWLEGYGRVVVGKTGEPEVEEPDIWSWGPGIRGEYIKEHFGKNLPKQFKTLDIFENGEATSIISRDTRLDSYIELSNLKSSIKTELNRLHNFDGFKLEGVEINPKDIKTKKLLLIIPTGEYTPERKALISELDREYKDKGITIEVKEFK